MFTLYTLLLLQVALPEHQSCMEVSGLDVEGNPETYASVQYAITFVADTPEIHIVKSISLNWDAPRLEGCLSEEISHDVGTIDVPGLRPGAYAFWARLVDTAGNFSEWTKSEDHLIIPDRIKPQKPIRLRINR